jgi:ribosome-binding factor A
MATRRQKQVAELLHQEISQLIQYRTQDPRLGFVTVTDVEISPDLRQARVYVTVLGNDVDAQSTLDGLASASGYFRRELGQSLALRYVPQLSFQIDTSLEYGMHIDEILDSIKEEQNQQDEGNRADNLSEGD